MSGIKKLFDRFKKVEPVVEKKAEPIKPKEEPVQPPSVTKVFKAVVLSQAPNPQWVYGKATEVDGKLAIIIPRRLTKKLVGKSIYVEAISDNVGTTYRYVQAPE